MRIIYRNHQDSSFESRDIQFYVNSKINSFFPNFQEIKAKTKKFYQNGFSMAVCTDRKKAY